MVGTDERTRDRQSARSDRAEPVGRVAVQVDRLCWSGVLLGLAFTMTNVQQFAANGARSWSLPWWSAWLLDPMVSLVLLAILRAEQVTARHGARTGGWARTGKWFTLAATYVMNVWQAFMAGSAALVVLHSVPPLVVFVATEAVTDLRATLGQVMASACTNTPPEPPAAGQAAAARRISFGEYLATARAARTPEVRVSPAWVRAVTGCSRGLSSRLADTLHADTPSADTVDGSGVDA